MRRRRHGCATPRSSRRTNGGVKCQREAKELEENAEAHARPAFEQSADRERDEKCPDEDDGGEGGFLRFEQVVNISVRQNIRLGRPRQALVAQGRRREIPNPRPQIRRAQSQQQI